MKHFTEIAHDMSGGKNMKQKNILASYLLKYHENNYK